MKTSVLEIGDLIQGFKISCMAENKSPKTTEWYLCFLEKFYRFLEDNGYPTRITKLDKTHIRAFILHLQKEARTPHTKRNLSHSTVQGYVRTLKSFFSWLKREEYLERNTMAGIPVPRVPFKAVNTFSQEQIALMVEMCRKSGDTGHRNLTIILLLLDSGIRVSELIGIWTDDVDLTGGFIRIREGKGRKERTVPIGSLVQKALWKYISQYRKEPVTEQVSSLFINESGLPLTRTGVQQMVRRYGKKAGISGVRCSPHVFRHTFAKNYLLNGGEIFSLQKILGHSSLASVRTYLNLFSSDVKRQHRRFSPVDNLEGIRFFNPAVKWSVKRSDSHPVR